MAFIHNLLFFSLYKAFSVFFSNQGAQGILGQPSKQQLITVFGTHKDVEVVTIILEKGEMQHSDAIGSGPGNLNLTRGSGNTGNTGKT